MKLGSAAKQPWLLSNALITLWNTYLPNLQQQRLSPLLNTLADAAAQVLAQPDAAPYTSVLFSLVTSYASAAEHATLLAVLAVADSARTEEATADAGNAGEDNTSAALDIKCDTASVTQPS